MAPVKLIELINSISPTRPPVIERGRSIIALQPPRMHVPRSSDIT